MAAAAANQAEVLLVSATWNDVRLGIVVGFSFEEALQDVVIRGEGVTGPSSRSPVARDLVCTLSFLVQPPIPPILDGCTPADLVITTQLADCTTQLTHTLHNMVPRGFAHSMNRDAPPAIWSQSFAHQSDMTSDNTVIEEDAPSGSSTSS